ncbi:MAG: hypothetical protein JSW10_05850 [Pseudomonadota bacterium]|nr:MAG: hypothetical protein JSW10_05850 [Pseudomonadota bacterium]
MSDDKRKGDKPIPDDVKNYLNDAQIAELHTIEGFGWELKFIRRPLFQERLVVVVNPDGSSIGVLEDDGRLNLDPNIETRE